MSYGNSNYGQGGGQSGDYGQQGGYGQSNQPDYGQGGYGQSNQPDYGQQPAQGAQPYSQSSGQDPYTQGSAPDPYAQQSNYAQGGYDQGYAQGGYGGVQPYAGSYAGGYDAAHPLRPSVGFVDAIKLFFKNYANFYGRASRSEYWWVALALFLVSLIIQIPGYALGSFDASTGTATMHPLFAVLSFIVSLATLVPSLAIAVRRMHDTGRSGWWNLIFLVPLVGWIIWIVFLVGAPKPEGVRFDNPNGSQPATITA
jgi:uncharacterized membrane protein YhaH (DUF805 family)